MPNQPMPRTLQQQQEIARPSRVTDEGLSEVIVAFVQHLLTMDPGAGKALLAGVKKGKPVVPSAVKVRARRLPVHAKQLGELSL